MHISDAFDAGNIAVLTADDPADIQLRIKPDHGSDHLQWFYFRLSGARGVPCRMRIVNAGQASYPTAWNERSAVASTDRQSWRRVDTHYADGELVLTHTPEADVIWFAYFAPYSWEDHQALLGRAADGGMALRTLGQTLDGRDLDVLTIGTGPKILWFLARQHPGETMAEHWMDGFVDRLLEGNRAVVKLLEAATLHIVPNMNPDGSVRGHLRTNAVGANLNREWQEPIPGRCPEVFHVLAEMDRTGVDFCLDVHGDEELPYVFLAGCEGIPSLTPRQQQLSDLFDAAMLRATPAFQVGEGYGKDAPGTANLTMCSNAVAERFGCLATTLEQPFKDNDNDPDTEYGWSSSDCRALGAHTVDALVELVAAL